MRFSVPTSVWAPLNHKLYPTAREGRHWPVGGETLAGHDLQAAPDGRPVAPTQGRMSCPHPVHMHERDAPPARPHAHTYTWLVSTAGRSPSRFLCRSVAPRCGSGGLGDQASLLRHAALCWGTLCSSATEGQTWHMAGQCCRDRGVSPGGGLSAGRWSQVVIERWWGVARRWLSVALRWWILARRMVGQAYGGAYGAGCWALVVYKLDAVECVRRAFRVYCGKLLKTFVCAWVDDDCAYWRLSDRSRPYGNPGASCVSE